MINVSSFFYDSRFLLVFITKKKKIAAQFFNDAETNNLKFLTTVNVNNNKIFKHLKFNIKINYNRILILWNKLILISFFIILKYCRFMINNVLLRWNIYEKKNSDVNPCEIKIAKHFMKNIVRDCCVNKNESFMYIMLQK